MMTVEQTSVTVEQWGDYMSAGMSAQHGEVHERFDPPGKSRRVYVDVALAHLSSQAQRNLWKAIHLGRHYGMGAMHLYESLSHRVVEPRHGY